MAFLNVNNDCRVLTRDKKKERENAEKRQTRSKSDNRDWYTMCYDIRTIM